MIITYHQLHATDPANPSLAAFEQSFEHLKDGHERLRWTRRVRFRSGSACFLALPSSTFNREDFPIPSFADAQSDKQRKVDLSVHKRLRYQDLVADQNYQLPVGVTVWLPFVLQR